jgi:hypothetical protein
MIEAIHWLPFIGYTLLIAVLVWLGLIRIPFGFSRTITVMIILGKLIAVPVFSIFYAGKEGGLAQADAGKFYHDASVINRCAIERPPLFLKILSGTQSDSRQSAEFTACLRHTVNWDDGTVKDYLYNDNRVVIRLHSVLHFFSFGSYPAHALFSCLMSLAGIIFLCLALRDIIPPANNRLLLLVLCFFPSLWFHTGALSKESLVVLVLGSGVYLARRIVERRVSVKGAVTALALGAVSFFLKAYLLLPALVIFFLFFVVRHSKVKYPVAVFLTALAALASMAHLGSLLVKDRGLVAAVQKQQRYFASAARGGIFLTCGDTFVRVPYDTALVRRVAGTDSLFSIRKGVKYDYWEDSHNEDTLVCSSNADTQTVYRLAYHIVPGRSNIAISSYGNAVATGVAMAIYYALFHPFFINANGMIGMIASFENLLLVLSLLIVLRGTFVSRKSKLPIMAFLAFGLLECMLVGFAAPNSGAIFRYRAPAAVFIVIAALYYFQPPARNRDNISLL